MKQFAVFDIDGTLVRWQLYHAIVDRLAKAGELGEDAVQRLKEARMKWKNREHHQSFADYEGVLIKVFESSLSKANPATFDRLIHEVITQHKSQVYTYTRDQITKLKQEGYLVLAISGSHHELVSEIARIYDFDDWMGSRYERTKGKYSGESYIASMRKQEILEGLIEQHHLTLDGSYAFGDSISDAPMMKMVDNPIAFNPSHELFEVSQENHWKIVIERKNVIYQLEWRNDGYVLAQANK